MPVGILYLLPCMTLTKQLLKVALTHVPLKVVLKILQLFVETMMTIYIHGRHWIPHHNKPSDNDCELDVIIHVVHQRRLYELRTDMVAFMKMSCMALRNIELRSLLSFVCSA